MPIFVDVSKGTGEIMVKHSETLLKFCIAQLWKENNRCGAGPENVDKSVFFLNLTKNTRFVMGEENLGLVQAE